jgi:hypothetical protein
MPRKNVFVSKERAVDLQRLLIILRKMDKKATLSLPVDDVILAGFASKIFTIEWAKVNPKFVQ